MIELEEALERILSKSVLLPTETVSLVQGEHRFTAENVTAPIPLPPFDNSAMDGYAVRSHDLKNATTEKPARLRLVGKVPAGESWPQLLEEGRCLRVFTGSPLPPGADAVVMQEEVKTEEGNQLTVLFSEPARPLENIRFSGEDIQRGTIAVAAGTQLNFAHLALISSCGLDRVVVYQRPRVAVMATGNELVAPGGALEPGKIFECNRLVLHLLSARLGALVSSLPLLPDSVSRIEETLKETALDHDVLITAGGISVGEFDLVQQAFSNLGGKVEFWKIAIKPGKPFLFGTLGEKLFFGLPGNPVSAAVTFLNLVAPALRKLQGERKPKLRWVEATLSESLNNAGSRPHFMAVRYNSPETVGLTGTQASHLLTLLGGADGWIKVEARTHLKAGTRVRVLPLAFF